MSVPPLRLGVNVDHVATLRNARGGSYPDPVAAAKLAEDAGADGITAHLREDRRHISDADIARLAAELSRPLNFEMAATAEMRAVALKHKPHAVCVVPERREERTTEGGLEVAGDKPRLREFIAPLREAGCRVSLFIGADHRQIEASAEIGAAVVELHTGAWCDAHHAGETELAARLLADLRAGARRAHALGLEVHAGHGLTYDLAREIARSPEILELNIGHFLISDAVFIGLEQAVKLMRLAMEEGRSSPVFAA